MRKLVLVFSLLAFLSGTLSSCGVFKKQDPAEKKLRALEKKKMQNEKEADDMYRTAIKKHMKSQTKAVRKRMKGSYAKSDRINDNKREFFLIRWFRGGSKTTKAKSGK